MIDKIVKYGLILIILLCTIFNQFQQAIFLTLWLIFLTLEDIHQTIKDKP